MKNCNNIRELLPHECLLHLPEVEHIEFSGSEGIEEIMSGGGESQEGSSPLNTPSPSFPSAFSPTKVELLEAIPTSTPKKFMWRHLKFSFQCIC